jgi:mono/diheme cytochrome c family protein
MKDLIRSTLAALAILMAGPAAWAQQDTPPVDPVEAGRKVYVYSCQRCHGIRLASMGIGFDLRTFPKDDKARFVRSVSNGTERGMPAWGSVLKPGQLDQLWAYIGAVNGWPSAAGPSTEAAPASAP